MNQKVAPTAEAIAKMGDFLAQVTARLGLKNDAALCRALGVAPPVISKTRNCTLPLGAAMLIRVHELTGIPTKEIRSMSGSTAGAPAAETEPA